MSPTPRFIFTTESPPARDNANGVVLLRHLDRLRAVGAVACVSIVPPDGACDFPQFTVPLRHPGFVPPRRWLPGSAALNSLQKAWHMHRLLRLGPGDHVISCLHEREHVLARRLARLSGARLTCLLHDLWPKAAHEAVVKTLRRAGHVFAVSENLARLARDLGCASASLLPPIGEDPLPPPRPPLPSAAVGIAGTLDSLYGQTALRFGLPVEAIGWKGPPLPGLRAVPRFPHNRDALLHLQGACRALLVYQNHRDEAYSRYSFPSRLVDFSQTGLPLLLVAPPDSNLGRWAAARGWRLWIRDEEDTASFHRLAKLLLDSVLWAEESAKVRALAEGEFNAGKIHQAFADALLRRAADAP